MTDPIRPIPQVSIPPVTRAAPAVRRDAEHPDQERKRRREQQHEAREQAQDELPDDGLPHVDLRA